MIVAVAELNPGVGRAELERHGLAPEPARPEADFEVLGLMAPLVVVRRKPDGGIGSLAFQRELRLFVNWREDL